MTPPQNQSMLELSQVSCGYVGKAVLSDISLRLFAGQALVFLGPNGVGKTTLFKTILGLLPLISGSISICGEDVSSWSRKQYARCVAYVPQSAESIFGFSVFEQVLMGRTPLIDGFATPSAADEQIASDIIDRLGLTELAERDCNSLSGGEKQMVLVARALAQNPKLLIMDEPCANLDIGNQVLVLTQVKKLIEGGLSVVMTSHDPNHALLLGGSVACIGKDGAVTQGKADSLLTPSLLSSLYGVAVGVGMVTDDQGRASKASAAIIDTNNGSATAAHMQEM